MLSISLDVVDPLAYALHYTLDFILKVLFWKLYSIHYQYRDKTETDTETVNETVTQHIWLLHPTMCVCFSLTISTCYVAWVT